MALADLARNPAHNQFSDFSCRRSLQDDRQIDNRSTYSLATRSSIAIMAVGKSVFLDLLPVFDDAMARHGLALRCFEEEQVGFNDKARELT